MTPSHCSWYVGTGTEYSIQYEKYYKTTFVGLAYLGSHIKFEGLSLTNKKVIPCRISIPVLAGNKVHSNNFLICE